MEKDIMDALAHISHSFRSSGLEPPAAIILNDHEQGMRLVHLLHQRETLVVPFGSERGGKPIEHPDGSVWMEVQVLGMKVRWPAMRMPKREGGYVWY